MDSRIRQIELGKSTPAYQNYIKRIPKEKRRSFMPKTPDMNLSRRGFTKKLREWRRALHYYDPKADPEDPNQPKELEDEYINK